MPGRRDSRQHQGVGLDDAAAGAEDPGADRQRGDRGEGDFTRHRPDRSTIDLCSWCRPRDSWLLSRSQKGRTTRSCLSGSLKRLRKLSPAALADEAGVLKAKTEARKIPRAAEEPVVLPPAKAKRAA